MFARPTIKQREQKRKQDVKNSSKKPAASNVKVSAHRPIYRNSINKIASIRTLPPFALINSESGGNSQKYS